MKIRAPELSGEQHEQQCRDLVAALDRVRRRRRTGDLPRKVSAIALARFLSIRIGGSADSRKRGVRLLVRDLRAQGVPIAADLAGYWLAEESADHAAYQTFLRRRGLSHLAEAARDRRSPAAADASGQLALFDLSPAGHRV